MALKTYLQKTGTTGTVGANTNPLPAADGADAKGSTAGYGRLLHNPFEFAYNRDSQDGTLAMEVSMDGINWSRCAIQRYDTNAVAATISISATSRFFFGLPVGLRVPFCRPVFFLAAGGTANDSVLITSRDET